MGKHYNFEAIVNRGKIVAKQRYSKKIRNKINEGITIFRE